mmetsp:Transcript_137273/g.238732  ORF Transcript_137273/g.238732 Transcript_137273/m.238732 type:complete len:94 (+) Transcript_137273:186-467(+)
MDIHMHPVYVCCVCICVSVSVCVCTDRGQLHPTPPKFLLFESQLLMNSRSLKKTLTPTLPPQHPPKCRQKTPKHRNYLLLLLLLLIATTLMES